MERPEPRENRSGPQLDPSHAEGRAAALGFVDALERDLWKLLEDTLASGSYVLSTDLRTGPTRDGLREKLEQVVAAGRWERIRSVVAECVRTGASVVAILSDETPQPRTIDEDSFATAARVVLQNHRAIQARMRLRARMHRLQGDA